MLSSSSSRCLVRSAVTQLPSVGSNTAGFSTLIAYPRARRRSCSSSNSTPGIILLSRYHSSKSPANPVSKGKEKETTLGNNAKYHNKSDSGVLPASSTTTTTLSRPSVSSTPRPDLSASPLNEDIPTPPSQHSNIFKGALADFRAAQSIGDIPAPDPELSSIRSFLRQSKDLFKFYWVGMKLLYSNSKTLRELNNGVKTQGWILDRRETVFARRTKTDLLRLIPFAMILAISDEVLPLIILYTPYLLPSTCVLPTQMIRIKTGEEETRKQGLVLAYDYYESNPEARELLEGSGYVKGGELDGKVLRGLCQAMDLGIIAPDFWLKRRLRKRLQWLMEDDALLRSEHNGKDLNVEERRIALAERGLPILYEPSSNLSTILGNWLKATSTSSAVTTPELDLSSTNKTLDVVLGIRGANAEGVTGALIELVKEAGRVKREVQMKEEEKIKEIEEKKE